MKSKLHVLWKSMVNRIFLFIMHYIMHRNGTSNTRYYCNFSNFLESSFKTVYTL